MFVRKVSELAYWHRTKFLIVQFRSSGWITIFPRAPREIDIFVLTGANEAGNVEFVPREIRRGVEEVQQVGRTQNMLVGFNTVLFRQVRRRRSSAVGQA